MCMMIYQPKDKTIPAEHVRRAVVMNSDGWGCIYRSAEGQIRSKADMNLGDAEGFVAALGGHELVFHARAGSPRTWTNLHPFEMRLRQEGKESEIWYMAHNGVFDNHHVQIENNRFSDTWHMARLMEKATAENKFDLYQVLNRPELLKEFERWLGAWNRLCFAGRGQFYIVNRSKGVWINGIWYSNDSLMDHPPKSTLWRDAVTKISTGAPSTLVQYPDTNERLPKQAAKIILSEMLKADDPYDCALSYIEADPQAVAILVQDYVKMREAMVVASDSVAAVEVENAG